MENFKTIPFCKDYEITITGIVRKVKGNKVLKHRIIEGADTVCLRIKNKVRTHYIHRLVYETFIDGNIKDGYISHIDGNKLNNNPKNLVFVKGSNTANAHKANTGDLCKHSKLKEQDVLVILQLLKEGVTISELAEIYNVSVSTIGNIKTGRRWKKQTK
jgi:hypothetical protein